MTVANFLQAQSLKIEKIESIGAAISQADADAWTSNFTKKFPEVTPSYIFEKATLENLLALDGVAGIYIINAIDNNGSMKLILKGITHNGELISGPNDIEEQKEIDNFKNTQSNRTFAQTFGRIVFERMLAQKGAESMLFAHAIDAEGQERMVLVALDKAGNATPPPSDHGIPCPPYCLTPSAVIGASLSK